MVCQVSASGAKVVVASLVVLIWVLPSETELMADRTLAFLILSLIFPAVDILAEV